MTETETTQITIQEFIEKHELTMTVKATNTNPYMEQDPKHPMDNWRCTLAGRDGRTMGIFFSTGRGLRKQSRYCSGSVPTKAAVDLPSVLGCLRSDSDALDYCFEEWADNLGSDSDSRKAHRTYEVCREQAFKLRDFLDWKAFQELRENVELY